MSKFARGLIVGAMMGIFYIFAYDAWIYQENTVLFLFFGACGLFCTIKVVETLLQEE